VLLWTSAGATAILADALLRPGVFVSLLPVGQGRQDPERSSWSSPRSSFSSPRRSPGWPLFWAAEMARPD